MGNRWHAQKWVHMSWIMSACLHAIREALGPASGRPKAFLLLATHPAPACHPPPPPKKPTSRGVYLCVVSSASAAAGATRK